MTAALAILGERLSSRLKRKRPRPLCKFVEDEIVIPRGRFKGLPFRFDRQPFLRLFYEAIDSGLYREYAVIGCVQSGKTLGAVVLLAIYYCLELGEDVIIGLPDMNIANDKWIKDIRPVIEASRNLAYFLPEIGPGSKGGKVKDYIEFTNGATLRFIAGGGKDQQRSSYTSRIILITEADKLGGVGTASEETSKIEQIKARADSYGDDAVIVMECTVSTTDGVIWTEYNQGSASRIERPCPYCGEFVTPGREDLLGWKEAQDETEARQAAFWSCPACKAAWTERERAEACRKSRLVNVKPGRKLGFRWTASDNLFWTAAKVAADEWKAERDTRDPEAAQKRVLQFDWSTPFEPSIEIVHELSPEIFYQHRTNDPRRCVPVGSACLTIGIDVGAHRLHWSAKAWLNDGSFHVVDFGTQSVNQSLGEHQSIFEALEYLRDRIFEPGFPIAFGKDTLPPRLVLIDAGWQPDVVHDFCTATAIALKTNRYLAAKGFGDDQLKLSRVRGKSSAIIGVDGFRVAQLTNGRTLVEHDAGQWKSYEHARWATPAGQRATATIFAAKERELDDFILGVTAERHTQEYKAGKGYISRWERTYRHNHYLDASALANCAARIAGIRIDQQPAPARQQQQQPKERQSGGFVRRGTPIRKSSGFVRRPNR